ncbi:Lsr2 dimerization domain-containing protein [Streptacidiphilus albus]|uniref:Lsr2 dimerization domain-containing protein n=1 Tax=Streptacidiphilus albus TaxID=105425 RepID=UPI0009DF9EBD|nr:histone-like nucleoid-structuring protein Lsr2 [Streptacidiphilus albus]
MAKKIRQIVDVTDDMTGEDVPEGKADSITLTLDGMTIDLDLHVDGANELRELLAPYFAAGSATLRRAAAGAPTMTATVVRGARRPSATRGTPRVRVSADDPHSPDARRKWLRAQGHEVNDRGRLAEALNEEYNKAHGLA